ncbi:hypothetical protein, partial [Estrella lausannensis]|uniref:hypothetical protein n=1 Tax=Estrella lausannensis TaxID=483423 RepID=UPI0019508BBF
QKTTKVAVQKGVVRQKTDFIVGPNGLTIPTNRNILETGFKNAGFQASPTRSAGMQYIIPNQNMKVRVMESTWHAPLRASFEHIKGGPINPFTGRPPTAPLGIENRALYLRQQTHMELYQ